MLKRWWLFLSLMLLLAGCGGGASHRPQTPLAEGSAKSATASESVGFADSQPSTQAAPAPPSAGSDARASRPQEEPSRERPGLGTEYGESRNSRVHDVTFERDSSRPFAIASLNYNDRKGVDALVANAERREPLRSFAAGGGAVTVSIRDENGDALEALRVGGRTFVIGQPGERYIIVLENRTSHRFEAVTTVDGLDVVNGKDGNFENRGYVLMPFATLEIEGFRQSMSRVAAFRFASVADSYAGQMGKARNVGVIGVAFFGERGDSFVPSNDTRLRDSASPFPADSRFAQPPRRF